MSAKEPTPCDHRFVQTYGIVDGPEAGEVTMWACQECRIRFYPHDAAERSTAVAEARHATLERVREGVERLPFYVAADEQETPGYEVDRGAVLALIKELDR